MTQRHKLTKLEVDLELYPVTWNECWDILARHIDRAGTNAALLDVFEWRYYEDDEEGYSIREIAEYFGITYEAARQRCKQMLKVLREAL